MLPAFNSMFSKSKVILLSDTGTLPSTVNVYDDKDVGILLMLISSETNDASKSNLSPLPFLSFKS